MLNVKKPWELTKEQKKAIKLPEHAIPEITPEEFINLSTWKCDLDDLKYNINNLSVDTFHSIIIRNLEPYYTDGFWQSADNKCQACDIWNGSCRYCPVLYWSVVVCKQEGTFCSKLMVDYMYSNWDKIGLKYVVEQLLEFYSTEEHIKDYKNWALEEINNNKFLLTKRKKQL